MNVALRVAAAALVAPFLMITGCGFNGVPQPPSLKLPQPVTDLSGERAGDEVHLQWTMPKRDTEKVILKGDQVARICRRVETGACQAAGELKFAPDKPAQFVDHLPAALISGSPRLLVYTVELENRLGHDAGPSNPVYAASGAAPPRISDLSAVTSIDGVILKWKSEPATELVRIHRVLVVDPRAKAPSQEAGSPPPTEQTLEVTAIDHGQALDPDAALDHVYRYTALRVQKFTMEGHAFEVTSAPSEALTINARDVFPPRVPEGLQAVADAEAHSIDLSWSPNPALDIAGYIVYRRESGSNVNPVRISPPGVVAPTFRDASPLPGHRYAYSVSAVDRDGNESSRSTEVEETLPQQ